MCSQGLHIVCAAGNSNEDACRMSPASSNRYDISVRYSILYWYCTCMCACSIAAAASDIQDSKASFSNYGTCVDLIAPVSYIATKISCIHWLHYCYHYFFSAIIEFNVSCMHVGGEHLIHPPKQQIWCIFRYYTLSYHHAKASSWLTILNVMF